MFPNNGIPGGCGIGVVIAMSDVKWIWLIEISQKRRSALEREGMGLQQARRQHRQKGDSWNRTYSGIQILVDSFGSGVML